MSELQGKTHRRSCPASHLQKRPTWQSKPTNQALAPTYLTKGPQGVHRPKMGPNRLRRGSAHPWVRPNPEKGSLGPSFAGALLVGPLFRIHGARPWLVHLLCQMGLLCMCNAGSDVLCISVVSSAFFHIIPNLCPSNQQFNKSRRTC